MKHRIPLEIIYSFKKLEFIVYYIHMIIILHSLIKENSFQKKNKI